MKNPESDLRSLVETFVRDMQIAVRETLVTELQTMLGGTPAKRGPKPGKRRGSGRPPKTAAKSGRRGRPAKVDAGLNDKVQAAIKAEPGRSVSDIAAGMRMKVDALKRPVAQLLAAKQIRKKGQRRGTKYYAA